MIQAEIHTEYKAPIDDRIYLVFEEQTFPIKRDFRKKFKRFNRDSFGRRKQVKQLIKANRRKKR